MIHAVRANKPSFNTVEFTDGFNVVLADRTQESTKKDSRNGLGKTTLIEIIHFCLGASTRPNRGLRVKALSGWSFSLELSLGERRVIARRSVDKPGRVEIEGDIGDSTFSTPKGQRLSLTTKEWTAILGKKMFGLLPRKENEQYTPTFRSLIGYVIRRGRDAFSTPFEHHRRQREWDKQVNNAYLLGLSWANVQAWQQLKDQGIILGTLKKAVTAGLVEGMLGSLGELEAERVRLNEVAQQQSGALKTFKVHKEYRQIERQASTLTREIHEISNQNVADRRMLGFYRDGITEVDDPETEDVAKFYEQVGIQLPGAVVRRLEEVRIFHHKLTENRRVFLAAEIERIEAAIESRESESRRLTNKRAELMKILEEHGALDDYTNLQRRHLDTLTQVKDLENRIQNLRKFEEGRSALKIDQERLHQRARRDHDDRRFFRERAISLFNAHSQALYQAPGRLVIDIGDKGFKFDVEIDRSGSQGIESMKVFCYDLMFAQLSANNDTAPGFLIHDSTIFDGVDERQVALALERTAEVSSPVGFQYICTLNSDTLPIAEFSEDFDIESFVRLRLTDATPEGSLLGIRYRGGGSAVAAVAA